MGGGGGRIDFYFELILIGSGGIFVKCVRVLSNPGINFHCRCAKLCEAQKLMTTS